MKKLNIVSIIVALVFLAIGGVYFIRNRMQRDYQAPVFSMDNDTITCSINATPDELKAGLTAQDSKDGDLTGNIMIEDIHIIENDSENSDDNKEKQFEITYVVFDSDNNLATVSRKLIYTDYVSPRFNILGPLQFTSVSAVELYSKLSVTDCIDDQTLISNKINIEMSDAFQNAISLGEYECTVSVTNSLGDSVSLPLTFDVIASDAGAPSIVLTDYLIYLDKEAEFQPRDYLSSLSVNGISYHLLKEKAVDFESGNVVEQNYGYYDYTQKFFFMLDSNIKVFSDVDTQKPGVYTVIYSYKHPETEIRSTVKLFVVVN